MKEVALFNKYSLWLLATLFLLPLGYLINPEKLGSYFTLFDNVSIPLWAGLYGLFWLVFTKKVKELKRNITTLQRRIDSFAKLNTTTYINEQREYYAKLDELTYSLSDAELHLEFINTALTFTLVIIAIVKLGIFLYNLVG